MIWSWPLAFDIKMLRRQPFGGRARVFINAFPNPCTCSTDYTCAHRRPGGMLQVVATCVVPSTEVLVAEPEYYLADAWRSKFAKVKLVRFAENSSGFRLKIVSALKDGRLTNTCTMMKRIERGSQVFAHKIATQGSRSGHLASSQRRRPSPTCT